MDLSAVKPPRHRLHIATLSSVAVVLSVFAALVFGRGAAQAATTYTYPDVNAPCAGTLQACVDGAAAGDTIAIAAGTYVTNPLAIDKAITLAGAGPNSTILQAVTNQRVISIAADIPGEVVVTGLRITGGNYNGSGGGLSAGLNTAVRLVSVDIRSNTATAAGANSGGGAVVFGPLVISDTTFIDNRAPNGHGGGLRAGSTVVVVNSRFERNTALNPGGGLRATGALTMVNTTVISNTTTNVSVNQGHGGGVRADDRLVMTGGEVRANSSQNDGGGVYVGADATISGTLILSNTGDFGGGINAGGALTLTNMTFARNVARVGGGGFLAKNGAWLTNLVFIDNVGGASGGGGASVLGSAVVTGTQFVGNSADFGGGLRVGQDALVTNSTFTTNTAVGDGGGLLVDGTNVTITNSGFEHNTADRSAGGLWAETNALVTATDFLGNTAGATGGGLHINGGTGRVVDVDFVGNHAGPTILISGGQGGGGIFANGGTLTLETVTLRRNSSDGVGGGVAADGTVVLTGTTFVSNTTTDSGGGLYLSASATGLAVQVSTFMSNTAGFGGGLYTYAAFVITDTDFLSNTASAYGGGLFGNALGTITRGRFTGNQTLINVTGSVAGGGAIYNDAGTITLESVPFVGNVSAQQGGALMATDSGAGGYVIRNSTFTGNLAQTGGAVEGAGPISIVNSSFTGNTAQGEGGGVNALGPLAVVDSIFAGNVAQGEGGGINGAGQMAVVRGTFRGNVATYGAGLASAGVATVTASLFVTNTATSEGGGLASSGHSVITTTVFDGNAANFGGALWLGVLNGNRVDRSLFARNEAVTDGGAIYVNSSTALTLTNSVVVANRAGNEGGGLSSSASGLHVINSTFAANQAVEGGGIMILSGALDLGNSILAYNIPDQINTDVALAIPGPNLVYGGGLLGAVDKDPQFARNPNLVTDDLGDLRLRRDSPALDAGNTARLPADLTLDFDGKPRRFDVTGIPDTGSGTPAIDLGAYEANNQVPNARINGPYAGNEGAAVALTAAGSGSGDVGQPVATYGWDCTDDGTVEVTSTQVTGSNCTYPDQGIYTLRLRVLDAGGFHTDVTTTVTIQNVVPTLSGQSSQSTLQGHAKLFVLGSFADPGADAPWQVTVAWGDGQTSVFTRSSNGALPDTSHTYTLSGVLTATVTVADKDGAADAADFGVTVTGQPGEVAGRVLFDRNGNGQPDNGEPPLPGAKVTLEGPVGDLEATLRTTTTDAQGFFNFDGLGTGNYILKIALVKYTSAGPVTVTVLGGQVTQTGNFALKVRPPDKTYFPKLYRKPLK